MVPHVSTPASSGSLLRDTTVCSVVTTFAATTTASTVDCGAAPWPPLPVTWISNLSLAAIMGPLRAPTRPSAS